MTPEALIVSADQPMVARWNRGLLETIRPTRQPVPQTRANDIAAALRRTSAHQAELDYLASDGGPAIRSWPGSSW